MSLFQLYINEQIYSTVRSKNVVQAILNAESHPLISKAIYKSLQNVNSVELLAIDKNNADNWMTSVYTSEYTREYGSATKEVYMENAVIRGIVYLEINHFMHRKCLGLKKGKQIIFFDGTDFVVTSVNNVILDSDTNALTTFSKKFPNHFDILYFDTIYEIMDTSNLTEELHIPSTSLAKYIM